MEKRNNVMTPEEAKADIAVTEHRLQNYFNTLKNKSEDIQSREKIVKVTHKELAEINKFIKTTEINEKNLSRVEKFLKEIFRGNNDGLRKMFDLEKGDRMVWNDETRHLVVMDKKSALKFSIRFTSYTPKETKEKAEIPRNNNLGEWIVKHKAYPGKKNSCGASCGELLNRFGFRSILPQSGRDGKNWDTILEASPINQYFDKVAVSHPDKAPAGSVLVFNENAKKGSSARRRFGHVEIKGADGNYYSYYASRNPAGSSRTPEKNPQEYRRLTGFTGYVYVYNGKTPPGKNSYS